MSSQHYCLICHHRVTDPEGPCPHCRSRLTPTAASPPLVLLGVFLVVLLLGGVAELMTRTFREQRVVRRQAHMQAAVEMSRAGMHEEAIREYRHALSYARDSFDARLGLARELYRIDRISEAHNHLIDLRAVDPTHAEVNYLLAEIAAHEGELDQAVVFYRTAIHGTRPPGLEASRLQMRFELIRLLESKGDQLQAIGELLELLEEAPEDAAVRGRVARLLLGAGAPRKAAGVFKELVRADPSDAQAFEGLGEAEFASGHYLSARTAFARSLALDSSRADVLESLRLCNRVVELDPTYRRAGTRERWRRSQQLLQRAIAELLVCSELPEPGALGPPQPLPEPAQRLFDEARAQVDASVDPAKSEEAVESNISLAEGLWAARQVACAEITPRDEPLRHVLVRLAQ